MARFMVGFTVWNRVYQIGWCVDSIEEYQPDVGEVRILLDGCTDGSEKAAARLEHAFAFPVSIDARAEQGGEAAAHNALIRYFMEETDYDAIIVLQHDQALRAPVFPTLSYVLAHYGEKVGYVGGRIGFEVNLSRVVGAPWAVRVAKNRTRLEPHTSMQRTYMNTGPIVYPRSTVERMGYLDEEFEHCWFVWEDYGARCKEARLQSVVIWTDIRHKGFGGGHCTWYDDGSHKRNRARMHEKWGKLGW